MPSQAAKRRPPAVAAPSPPDEAKKKAAPIRRASAKGSKAEGQAAEAATPLAQQSKKHKRSIVGVGVVAAALAL